MCTLYNRMNVYKYSIQGKTQLDSVKLTLSSGLQAERVGGQGCKNTFRGSFFMSCKCRKLWQGLEVADIVWAVIMWRFDRPTGPPERAEEKLKLIGNGENTTELAKWTQLWPTTFSLWDLRQIVAPQIVFPYYIRPHDLVNSTNHMPRSYPANK